MQLALALRYRTLAVLLLTVVGTAGQVSAAPFFDPGDLGLRQDIELLADSGVIQVPITTWPMSWGDIARDLERAPKLPLDAGEQAAVLRLKRAVRLETISNEVSRSVRTSLASDPRSLRTFEDTPRDNAEVRTAVEWTGLRIALRLQTTFVASAEDNRDLRADGSYLALSLGNYMISVGQLERWWGPGWNGSMILSTNARPIPALAIRRNFSDPFNVAFLRWMGPWTMTALMGQLEGGRFVSNARFFGVRFNFRPMQNLEIGISRSAQLCGTGRPCGFSTFTDLLLGQDNREENTTLAEEPGNQLAGVDWRWRLPGKLRLSWYGQLIGEDEAGNLPSRYIALSGVSWQRYLERLGSSLSVQLEFADSAAEFYKTPQRYDYAYEHFIYKDGYRYRDRSIGHALDNDGRMLSLNASLQTEAGRQWHGMIRVVDLNRGGELPNPLSAAGGDLINLEFSHSRPLGPGEVELGIGLDQLDDFATGLRTEEFRAHAVWRGEW